MKKITAIILACLTLILTVTAGAANETKTGDVNRDGTTDNKDVVVLFRYVSGVIYDVFDQTAADMNNDKAVNNKDVTLLFRYISAPHEPTDKPVVIGMSYVDGRYLVYGSAEPFSVIHSVDAYGGEAENVCNNKYFYVEVSASEGDKLSFYATAPGKLESKKTSVTVTASAYSSNIFVGKNSRIFYLPTRSFLEGCEADTNSLAAIKSYISGKTIKEIQKATGKKTKLIYAIIPDPATAYYDEQNFEMGEPVNSAMRSFVKEIDGCHEDVYALDLFSVMRA